jgi:hypothetical protein
MNVDGEHITAKRKEKNAGCSLHTDPVELQEFLHHLPIRAVLQC